MAQKGRITISGQVIDAESKEPLVFATVGIQGASFGTVSNANGEFDFHFPDQYLNATFGISMLGYITLEMPVSELTGQGMVILEMNKAVHQLEEITIEDSLSAGEIAQIALSRISQNHPDAPYMMHGFYRDIKKIGGKYFSLLEAAVKIYDEDYEEPRNKFRLREKVALVEVRKSLGYNHRFTKYFDQSNLLEELLLHNNIKYRQFAQTEYFFDNFRREKNSFYNGRPVFVICQSSGYKLQFYIDIEEYKILRMEYEIGTSDKITKKGNMVNMLERMSKVIDYREYDGKMYLNYMQVTSYTQWYDRKTMEKKFSTELIQELLVNEIEPHSEEQISSTEKMKRYGLQFQDRPYNKEFWDNYNFIKESPLDQQVMQDLESEKDLEEQFRDFE